MKAVSQLSRVKSSAPMKNLVANSLLLLAALSVAGCSAANSAADAVARDAAKSVVEEYVEDAFPGLRVAPVTDCIIDNASAGEILTIARASALGTRDTATLNLVGDVAQRPATVQCIAGNGLNLLG